MVTGESGPAERLRIKVPLVDLPVFGSGEVDSPLVKFPEPSRHLLGDGFGLPGIVDEVSLVEGVGSVNRPTVLGITRTQRTVDATPCPGRVCVAVAPLSQYQHVLGIGALLDYPNGCSGTGRTCPDNKYRHIYTPIRRERLTYVTTVR